jgi:hypothetical protein
MRSACLLCALSISALLALGACGKKGDPEPPQPDQFPHQYPAPETIPETGNDGQQPGSVFTPQPSLPDPLRPIYQ